MNFDHLVPYSYSQNNYPYDFVAACRLCNRIKCNLMFIPIEEARTFIRGKLAGKGTLYLDS